MAGCFRFVSVLLNSPAFIREELNEESHYLVFYQAVVERLKLW